MREIKFRAWEHKLKKMLYNVGIYEDGTPFVRYDGGTQAMPLDNRPVMQYTGLQDKNGKEIYEGDICELNQNIVQVVWVEGCGRWDLETPETKEYDAQAYEDEFGLGSHQDLEIIGDIYQNPDLLKV